MAKQRQVINGVIVDRRREYSLREAAPILGVSYEMIRKYVGEYGFLKPRHPHEQISMISGEQLIYFWVHKADMIKRRRVLMRDQRDELLKHMQTTEQWMQEAPVDNTWAENKMAALAAAAVDPSLSEEEDQELGSDDSYYPD